LEISLRRISKKSGIPKNTDRLEKNSKKAIPTFPSVRRVTGSKEI